MAKGGSKKLGPSVGIGAPDANAFLKPDFGIISTAVADAEKKEAIEKEFDLVLDASQDFFQDLQANDKLNKEIFNPNILTGDKRRQNCLDLYSDKINTWNALTDKYIKGERDAEFLKELKNSFEEIKAIIENIVQWENEKDQREELFAKRPDWQTNFAKAKDEIFIPNVYRSEFIKQAQVARLFPSFQFNLREKLEEFLNDEYLDNIAQMKKIFGAVGMMVKDTVPYTCVVLKDGKTYVVTEQEVQTYEKNEKRKENKEFLNEKVREKLKELFKGDGKPESLITRVSGKEIADKESGAWRSMAFLFAKDFIEDDARLNRLASQPGIFTPEDEDALKAIVENCPKEKLYELVFELFAFENIGKRVSDWKDSPQAGEKYIDENWDGDWNALEWEVLDKILPLLDVELQSFVQYKLNNGSRSGIDDTVREKLEKQIKDLTDKAFPSKKSPIAPTPSPVPAPPTSPSPSPAPGPPPTPSPSPAPTPSPIPTAEPIPSPEPVPASPDATADKEKAEKEQQKKLYESVSKESRGVFSLDRFQQWNDKYKQVASDAGFAEDESLGKITQRMEKDLDDLLNRYAREYKIKEEDKEKIIRYVLDNLK